MLLSTFKYTCPVLIAPGVDTPFILSRDNNLRKNSLEQNLVPELRDRDSSILHISHHIAHHYKRTAYPYSSNNTSKYQHY